MLPLVPPPRLAARSHPPTHPPTHPYYHQDFGGFRVVVLLPRFRPQWPSPPPVDNPEADYHYEAPLKHGGLIGAQKPPVPILAVSGTGSRMGAA